MSQDYFAVSRNGAVWKCHDRIEPAMDQAQRIAEGLNKHEKYQGFDENNKSAVVSLPVTVRVERLNRTNNMVSKYEAVWLAGDRIK